MSSGTSRTGAFRVSLSSSAYQQPDAECLVVQVGVGKFVCEDRKVLPRSSNQVNLANKYVITIKVQN